MFQIWSSIVFIDDRFEKGVSSAILLTNSSVAQYA